MLAYSSLLQDSLAARARLAMSLDDVTFTSGAAAAFIAGNELPSANSTRMVDEICLAMTAA
jgi:hypothetical protein